MSHDHDARHDPERETEGRRPPSKLRLGTVLIGFLAAAGLLLAYEHRAHILTGNGFLIALLVLCVGMHFFMHGGHGRHGGKQ